MQHNADLSLFAVQVIMQQANQVWLTDITYIPSGKGHVYLSAVIDWHSRFIVSWRLHDTLDADQAVQCLGNAVNYYGCLCNL